MSPEKSVLLTSISPRLDARHSGYPIAVLWLNVRTQIQRLLVQACASLITHEGKTNCLSSRSSGEGGKNDEQGDRETMCNL